MGQLEGKMPHWRRILWQPLSHNGMHSSQVLKSPFYTVILAGPGCLDSMLWWEVWGRCGERERGEEEVLVVLVWDRVCCKPKDHHTTSFLPFSSHSHTHLSLPTMSHIVHHALPQAQWSFGNLNLSHRTTPRGFAHAHTPTQHMAGRHCSITPHPSHQQA